MDTYNRFIKTDGLGNNDAVTIEAKMKKIVSQNRTPPSSDSLSARVCVCVKR